MPLPTQPKSLITHLVCDLLKNIVAVSGAFIEESFWSLERVSNNIEFYFMVNDAKRQEYARLKPDFEYAFFRKVFHNDRLRTGFHYTSFESLYYILNGGQLHLNALTGMNDKYETNYVNDFMGKVGVEKYNATSIAYQNSHFIFSLSEVKDQLNQWRLYGDDAKGVLVEFEIDHEANGFNNILFSKVRYDLNLFKLIKTAQNDFKTMFEIGFNLEMIDYWKFFFKHEDYAQEEEIRLMVRNMSGTGHKEFESKFKLNRYGLIIPFIELDCFGQLGSFLKVKRIILGPKVNEPALNKAQIEFMLSKKYPSNDIEVIHSRIEHYR
ncbi:DUF2971 domain-containing protein [Pedobacter frigidisoli]|uniref:DUF2971 domain-containing protein n=1 Tax=Pedobacter frigidisoli TaxID=2530455 RepID=UPI00292DF433|nr:DUF2971 domain-containing protein [Pedobacter frigidisoli]